MGVDSGAKSTKHSSGTAHAAAAEPEILIQVEPTEAEIGAWAESERKRREAWLQGPTDAERAEFARHERERRLAEFDEADAKGGERRRPPIGRYTRETQLAAEGAMSLMWRWSRRSLAELVKAGREWEEETAQSSGRRRVPFDDEGR